MNTNAGILMKYKKPFVYRCAKCRKIFFSKLSFDIFKDENSNFYNWEYRNKEVYIKEAPLGVKLTKCRVDEDCYDKLFYSNITDEMDLRIFTLRHHKDDLDI